MSWREIETFDRPDGEYVDVWMRWPALPSTMGMGDSFKLEGGAFKDGAHWYHAYNGNPKELLRGEYVLFWAPLGEGPEDVDPYEEMDDRREYERLKKKFGAGTDNGDALK